MFAHTKLIVSYLTHRQRPLPKRPQTENPYYEPQDVGIPVTPPSPEHKQSEDNELYSLYSSITDLKPKWIFFFGEMFVDVRDVVEG